MIGLKLFSFFKRNQFEQTLKKSVRMGHKKFLLVWNRGLGDIALGVWGVVEKIKEAIPNAEITILTRPDLEEGFYLLENVKTIAVPNWKRGKQINLIESLSLCGMHKEKFDIVLEKVNPTNWLKKDLGNFVPKLKWRNEYDQLWQKFNLNPTGYPHIAVHLHTETEEFYGYNKNWPQEKFIKLFDSLLQEMEMRIIFLGVQKKQFWQHPAILDLRGETTVLEMLSIVKNCCPILIAPDGGVLSLVYYLNVEFPLTIISLWGDANQGVLKQSVPSPNPKLKHIPIIGKNGDINSITIEEVLTAVRIHLKESSPGILSTMNVNNSSSVH